MSDYIGISVLALFKIALLSELHQIRNSALLVTRTNLKWFTEVSHAKPMRLVKRTGA